MAALGGETNANRRVGHIDAGDAEARHTLDVACTTQGSGRDNGVGAKAVPSCAMDEVHFFVEGHLFHDKIGAFVGREGTIEPRTVVRFRLGRTLGRSRKSCEEKHPGSTRQEMLSGK